MHSTRQRVRALAAGCLPGCWLPRCHGHTPATRLFLAICSPTRSAVPCELPARTEKVGSKVMRYPARYPQVRPCAARCAFLACPLCCPLRCPPGPPFCTRQLCAHSHKTARGTRHPRHVMSLPGSAPLPPAPSSDALPPIQHHLLFHPLFLSPLQVLVSGDNGGVVLVRTVLDTDLYNRVRMNPSFM